MDANLLEIEGALIIELKIQGSNLTGFPMVISEGPPNLSVCFFNLLFLKCDKNHPK